MIYPKIVVESLYTDSNKPWRWVLVESVTITLSNGDVITIPAGYKTDFASVPRVFRGIVATVGNQNAATLIHDWLYDNRYSVTNGENWEEDRLFADKEMYYWLRRCGASFIKAKLMYFAVRVGGRKWWLE